jgi:hypothetical protein
MADLRPKRISNAPFAATMAARTRRVCIDCVSVAQKTRDSFVSATTRIGNAYEDDVYYA